MILPDGISKVNLKDKYHFSDHANQHFLKYIVTLKAQKSFARDDNDLDFAHKIDQWFSHFEYALKEIFDDQDLKLSFSREKLNFEIQQTGKEPFDFSTLSDGYSSILNIVTELILRMENKSTMAFDVQGIVLIDEIKSDIARYDSLINKEQLSESEKDDMYQLKNYLKQLPAQLAPELVSHFQSLELKIKAKIKNG